MEPTKTYCDYVKDLPLNNIHRIYHDTMYGFALNSDNELFERLILEINQAGLSWNTILNKMQSFKDAYSNFDIKTIAQYDLDNIERLLNNPGIIRNKLKVNAAIHNANVILELQKKFGSFKNWLDANIGLSKEDWTKLFKKTFVFTGGEIVNEFLMSTRYLPGAHSKTCPVYDSLNSTI